jgi:hypothetical protein
MGAGAGGAVLLRESMSLMRSFEKSEGRFVSVVAGRPVPPRGTLLEGSGRGEGGVGVVGHGETGAVATCLSAMSVSRRAVGALAVLSTVNFSCR